MKSFKEYISEAIKKLKWNPIVDIGWWEDQDKVRLYHGTHISNVESVSKKGLDRKDPDTGMISLALDPFTARGYASMHGGETYFRKVGGKSKIVPTSERAVFVFDVPTNWLKKHMDKKFGGNVGSARDKLSNKSNYEKWTKSDTEYYQLTEFRVNVSVPVKFIIGYMLSK